MVVPSANITFDIYSNGLPYQSESEQAFAGNVISFNNGQLLEKLQNGAILVTVSGITIFSNIVHPLKAHLPIVVTPSGITIDFTTGAPSIA